MNLQKHYLSVLAARPVAYNPRLAKLFHSINAALVFSQFLYWQERAADDGWFWKTRAELYEEIGMGRYEFEGARRILRDLQVLEEELRGAPARNFYRLNLENFEEIISRLEYGQLAENSQLDGGKTTNKLAEKPPTSKGKTSQLYKEADSTSETTPDTTYRKRKGKGGFTTHKDEREQIERYFSGEIQ